MNPVPYSARLHISLQRLVRWEFWPWRIVYLPVAVYWFFLAIRARGWVYFSAANPCMRFGGLVAYSKWEVLKEVSGDLRPHTIIIEAGSDIDRTLERIRSHRMTFPFIIKPDMGERGKGVRILRNEQQLRVALKNVEERMMLQKFEDLPLELGILYSRHPDEKNGRITSIVIKEFPTLTGDGRRNLLQLILSNERTRFNYKTIVARFEDRLDEIPAAGRVIETVALGNHMLGSTFRNGNHLRTGKLEQVFDGMAKQLDGFYIGRFDVRTVSIADLENGNFKVIEVNGAGSEPAHIYDPDTSLYRGIADLLRHWKRLYDISIANHRNGAPYGSFREIRAEIRRHHAA